MSRNYKEKLEASSTRRSHTFMSAEDVAAGKKSFWQELEITGSIRNLSSNMWKLSFLTSLYLNDNLLSRIPGDIGKLTNLRTLDLSNNKLRSLPAELGELVYLRELLLNNNYLRALPYELGKLFHLQVLGLQGNPLNKEILALYGELNGTQQLLSYMLNNLRVTANPPPQRPWLPLSRPDCSHATCLITVMCYNVLCDKYATRQLYGYCPQWALEWNYRKTSIVDEIKHYAADIVNLQEVEADQYFEYFLPELKKDGYEGVFAPKSRAKTMSENDRKYVDGCAIFFRNLKFKLLKKNTIEFNQLAMVYAEGSEHMLNRVMPRDNIGLAVLLETKEPVWDTSLPKDRSLVAQPIAVCTAHIHWDPEYSDVKLIQTMMLTKEVKGFLEESSLLFYPNKRPDASNIQLVLCGDFNSLPESGVVEYLSTGRVSADHPEFRNLDYTPALRKLTDMNSFNECTHSLNLVNAYADNELPYTNFTFDFKGVIDYIFITGQRTESLGVLGPLNPEWIKENKVVGCPHPHIPSDHFPLLVEIEMRPTVPIPTNGIVTRR